MNDSDFLLISPKVLQPVFAGVVYAKELLASGKASNVSAAIKEAGISRTAFYKYKDFVFKYSPGSSNTLSFNALLYDRAGVFSSLTAALFECGANIITVSQGLPENGTAKVSMTISISNESLTPNELFKKLMQVDGVISITEMGGGKK